MTHLAKRVFALGVALALVAGAAGAQQPPVQNPVQDDAGEVFMQLRAPLDEPRHFCFDAAGFADKVRWNEPIQAHTCKEAYDHGDQLLDRAAAAKGRLRLPRYDHCLEPRGGKLYGAACSSTPAQMWKFSADGRLSPASAPGQCVTVGPKTLPAGHPPEVKPPWVLRPVTVEPCSPALAERQQWALAHSKQKILR